MASHTAVWKGRTSSFPAGGVHPHENKEYTSHVPIRNAPIPSRPVIPLHQHMGKPAQCIVNVGDELREGMLIGKADGFFSANVHSPVPGKVAEITDIYLPNGIKSQAVVAELEGEFDRSGKNRERRQWESLSAKELLDKIQEMGIVGLGGATFPAHMKYFIREGLKAEYFVVNGVECEPYLTSDHRLMLEKTKEILEGTRIVQKILEPDHVLIGIEANKPDAVETMMKAVLEEGLDFQVRVLNVRYPQGDEKQLLKALIDREVPSGGLPIDIGAVVSNVGTIFSIYEAVVFDKPVIERFVTVSGSVIKEPANLKVRIGTPVRDLIEECGGFTDMPAKLVSGGPMMGFALADIDSPVTKGTSGIVALSRREAPVRRETSCIHCGQCIRSCPFGLNPTELYRLIDHQQYDSALSEGLMDCKECGCCAYSCPAGIPLVQGIKLGKLISRKKKVK
jgi:electron transport complex protein RnfC